MPEPTVTVRMKENRVLALGAGLGCVDAAALGVHAPVRVP